MVEFAIDASGTLIDLTLFENGRAIFQMYSIPKKTHSQLLVNTVDFMLNATALGLDDIDTLYCVAGPGRHTSIRVVISTLKGLFFKREKIDCFRVNALDLTASVIDKQAKFRVVGEFFSKMAYFSDYEIDEKGRLKRLNEPKKARDSEIFSSDIEVYKANDISLYPKTPNIHKVKEFAEKVELFSLNPIY